MEIRFVGASAWLMVVLVVTLMVTNIVLACG